MTKNPPASLTAKKAKRKCKPPLDAFGLNPSFYLQGKDKTVSWVGFICSLMLILSIATVVIIESISYLQNKNSEIYVNLEASQKYPIIDLTEKKFIVVIRNIYTGSTFAGVPQEKFFQVNYYRVTQSEDKELDGVIFAADRTLVPQIPCEELKMDLSGVNYSSEELKGAKCIEFTGEAKIGGSYETGLLYKHDIEIVPCKIEGTETCEVDIEGVPTNTRDTTGPISQYFQDYVLEISYIQDTADVGNFKKPILRNLNSEIRLRFDAERQTYINYEFSQLKIETTSGSYKKETEVESGLYLKSSFFNVNPRDPTIDTQFFLDG